MLKIDILDHLEKLSEWEKPAFFEIGKNLEIVSEVSYKSLWKNAVQIAHRFRQLELVGEPVLLAFPNGIDFVVCFLGALLSGALPVPSHLAHWFFAKRSLSRLVKVARASQAKHIVAQSHQTQDLQEAFKSEGLSIEVHDFDEWKKRECSGEFERKRADIAFFQFTSGTTGEPKKISISHENLWTNTGQICQGHSFDEDLRLLSWLPHSHDMGLVGGIFVPLRAMGTGYLMSAQDFLRSPLNWLKSIAKYQIICSPAPNFAFDLCVQRYLFEKPYLDLNLSSWRVAFNGGEMVKAATIFNFTKTFSSFGFSLESMWPCYGMAEATLMVSGKPMAEKAKFLRVDSRSVGEGKEVVPLGHFYFDELEKEKCEGLTLDVVSCGGTLSGVEFSILDENQRELVKEGVVGRIKIRGKNVFGSGEHVTSDLGFSCKGELYLLGRVDDAFIVNGEMYHPVEFEEVLANNINNEFVSEFIAYMSTLNSYSSLNIAVELKKAFFTKFDQECRKENLLALEQSIKETILKHFLMSPNVIFLRQRAFPRTTSGKLQRNQVGELPTISIGSKFG